MECGWYAYQSKTGQTLFFFNQITGEYKWLSCSCSKNLQPLVPNNNNALKAVAPKVVTDDLPNDVTRVHVRSIGTEADLPATQKIFKTQGTQTECLGSLSCTDATLTQNVLPTVVLENGSDQHVLAGGDCKSIPSRNTSLLQQNNSNGKCRDEEKSKVPRNHQNVSVGGDCNSSSSRNTSLLQENNSDGKYRDKVKSKVPRSSSAPEQTSKVKLFDCSYCEKAFTSYAFLVKHEKYHVQNDIQKKVCDDLHETILEDSISSDPDAALKKNDHHSSNDASRLDTQCSTLMDTPPSSETDSTCSAFSQPCFQCGKCFTSSDEFDIHLSEHIKERFCNPCQKSYCDDNQFVRHVRSFHVTRRHQCYLCIKRFLLKSSMVLHLKNFHRVKYNEETKGNGYSYKCGSCEASFKLSTKLLEHQQVVKHKGTAYQCNDCGKCCSQFDDLQQHLMQEHNPNSSSPSNSAHENPSPCKKNLRKKVVPGLVSEGETAERHWCHECNVSYLWYCDLVRHRIKKKCGMDKPVLRMNGKCMQYLCRYDDRAFDDKEQFLKHYIKHFKKNMPPLNCDECPETFDTFESLEKHLAVHLDSKIRQAKIYSCEICGKSFGSNRNCRRHVRCVHKKRDAAAAARFCCDICNKVYHHRSSLASHKKTHYSFRKEDAQKVAERMTNYAVEEPQTKQQKPAVSSATGPETHQRFKCGKCQRTFSSLECLNRHKKVLNHGETPHVRSSHVPKPEAAPPSGNKSIYHCPVCKRSFKYYNVFYKHRASHGEKARVCKICNKIFKASNLSSNKCLSCKKLPPKVIEELYSCKVCGKRFLEARSLKSHMQAHNRGSFDCTSCHIAFPNEERLKKHMKNHKSELGNLKKIKPCKGKLHECSKCGKLYSGRKGLVRHRKICSVKQENAQPVKQPVNMASNKGSVKKEDRKKSNTKCQNFGCQKCQKSFSLYGELFDHYSEHGEERPCCICYKFMTPGSLKRHLCEQHTQDHTFYCHVCSEEFHDLSGLINHISFVPGVKKHKCTKCGQLFAFCNGLKEHMKLVHTSR